MRCSWQYKDADPKNQAVINPCFRVQFDPNRIGEDPNAKALTDDLAAGLESWLTAIGGSHKQLTVKAYDIQGPHPNYPLATTKLLAGSFTAPSCPAELAICLSFYGAANTPRHRGRLYLPAFMLNLGNVEMTSPVVSSASRDKVGQLVPKFAALGGLNVDWIVWSQVGGFATRVENWFVDESWDIQRRRGLASTARTTGTTSG